MSSVTLFGVTLFIEETECCILLDLRKQRLSCLCEVFLKNHISKIPTVFLCCSFSNPLGWSMVIMMRIFKRNTLTTFFFFWPRRGYCCTNSSRAVPETFRLWLVLGYSAFVSIPFWQGGHPCVHPVGVTDSCGYQHPTHSCKTCSHSAM